MSFNSLLIRLMLTIFMNSTLFALQCLHSRSRTTHYQLFKHFIYDLDIFLSKATSSTKEAPCLAVTTRLCPSPPAPLRGRMLIQWKRELVTAALLPARQRTAKRNVSYLSFTDSIKHGFNQTRIQSFNHWFSQSLIQSFNHQLNQSWIQSINKSINGLSNHCINKSMITTD